MNENNSCFGSLKQIKILSDNLTLNNEETMSALREETYHLSDMLQNPSHIDWELAQFGDNAEALELSDPESLENKIVGIIQSSQNELSECQDLIQCEELLKQISHWKKELVLLVNMSSAFAAD